jgi:hypothetical protein
MTIRGTAFERLSFVDGQRLAARDLQSSVDNERCLAALHMRGLHDTWGVVFGLDVRILDNGTAGQSIQVTPGLAYDRCGRTVFLQEPLTLSPPPLPAKLDKAWFDLVIRCADEADDGASKGACDAMQRSGLHVEQPLWRWAWAEVFGDGEPPPLARDVHWGIEIPLARIVSTSQGAAAEHAGFAFRQIARRQVRPHMAGSHLDRGSLSVQGGLFAWSVVIDTSEGGFSRTPHYFVTLAEHPLLILLEALDPALIWTLRFLLGPFVWVHEATRDSFRLSVGFAFPALSDQTPIFGHTDYSTVGSLNAGVFAFPNQEEWEDLTRNEGALKHLSLMQATLPALDWLGVESVADCYERLPIAKAVGSWADLMRLNPESVQ